MKKIEPISSWQNGQEMLGTEFNLRIVTDNLSTEAKFYYNICTAEVSHLETVIVTPEVPAWDETLENGDVVHHDAIPAVTTDVLVIDVPSYTLIENNLIIEGAEYQQWDIDPNANEWAYNWAINKLNLTAVPTEIIS